jgi:hypothetical protein
MLNMLAIPALTLVFIAVVFCLGAAFVWMFWEFEQAASKQAMFKANRNHDRLG